MFSKILFAIGGLCAAVLMIAAADAYVARAEIVNADFVDGLVDDVLDDPVAREPLVDELTQNWIEANPERFALMVQRVPDAEASLRDGIDEVLAGPDLRAQLAVSVLELAPRQDALGVETITLDMSSAVASVRSDLPPEVAETLAAETDIVFERDLSRVSEARSLLGVVVIVAAGGALVLVGAMSAASRSLRRTSRSVAVFGLPVALVQTIAVDRLVPAAPRFSGEDTYAPIVAERIAQTLGPTMTAIAAVFAVLLLIEAGVMIGARTRSGPAQPVAEPPIPLTAQPQPQGITWVETDRPVDRLAS